MKSTSLGDRSPEAVPWEPERDWIPDPQAATVDLNKLPIRARPDVDGARERDVMAMRIDVLIRLHDRRPRETKKECSMTDLAQVFAMMARGKHQKLPRKLRM